MQLVLAQEVAQREVVELDTHATDDTRLSPTERELQLVVGLLLQVPVDVDGAVFVVGLHVGVDRLGVEIAHGGYFTGRTLQGVLREQVAGLGTQLTAHHLFVEPVVTVDAHGAEVGLRSFGDAHLQVDGVAHDVHLGRVDAREHVAVVVVVVTHGILVLQQSLVHELLVVDVALLHAQCGVQIVGSDDGIAHPGDVAQVVFLTFLNLHVDVDVLLVDVPHGVFEDGGIAEAQLVVFLDEGLLGLVVALGSELLRLEEIGELAGLMDLAEGTLGEQATLDFCRFSCSLPSMMMWRTFILSFLSMMTSSTTWFLPVTSSRWLMSISAFL